MRLLDGKTVVVTGGGGGLGRSYALALAKAGGAVAVSDINVETARATTDVITKAGGRAVALQADVTRAGDFERLFDRTETELGAIDVLINLAGTFPKNAVVDLPEEEWDAVMTLNLKSVFLGSRAAIRRMIPRKRGVVLSAASGTAARGVPKGSAYAASKGAIIAFTRSVALELQDTGVRINCFAPGPTDTALWREGKRAEDVERVVAAGLVYEPDEFSNIVVFLASDFSAPMNGEFINRDVPR
jgi:NAD(P)-dependent dehydrogenase (short-subunit alcohol dehydrogenase family)